MPDDFRTRPGCRHAAMAVDKPRPALPVGAYAYSQGLEYAVEAGVGA